MFTLFPPLIHSEIIKKLSIKEKSITGRTCKYFNEFLGNKRVYLQIGNMEITATKSKYDSSYPDYHVEVTINKEHNNNSINFDISEQDNFLAIVKAIDAGPLTLIEILKQQTTDFNRNHYTELVAFLETYYAANPASTTSFSHG